VASVVSGLFASLQWDTPSGPTIVVAAVCLFMASLLVPASFARRGRQGSS
jgi:zinc transport system permease protein